MTVVLSVLIGYLFGSISFSYLIGKRLAKIDIREHGSGNAGATNTLRVLGTGPAIVVLFLDILKGIAAIVISYLLGGEEWAPFLAGLFAIVGHNWPIFSNFRGGKGVATTIGVFATMMTYPALMAGAVAIILIVLTRYVSLGSLAFIGLTPLFALVMGRYPLSFILLALIVVILSFWRHRSNLYRLIQGTENKLGQKQTVKDVKNP